MHAFRKPLLILFPISLILVACDGKPTPAGTALPKGALLLMAHNCPNGFADATGQFNGRLISVDTNAVDAPVLTDGDGSHGHSGGAHAHSVTGNVDEPGEGYREGGGGRRSAGVRSPIVGQAQAVGHEHDGGSHKHGSVGLRLCEAA